MISVQFPTLTLANEYSDTVPYLADAAMLMDSLTTTVVREQRPRGVGEYPDDEPESPGLEFTVFGEYRVAGGDWEAFRRQIMTLRNLGWFDLTLTTAVSRSLRVRVVGKIEFDLIDERLGFANFSVPMWAPDPRRYGPLQSDSTPLPVAGGGVESPLVSPLTQIGGGSPGQLTMQNDGTENTVPTFTVSGGGATGGVEITRIETAERLRLEWPILDTDVVTFDPGEGQVWLNDQAPISGYLARADWWVLGPGETATVQFEAFGTITGSPTLSATWRDADS